MSERQITRCPDTTIEICELGSESVIILLSEIQMSLIIGRFRSRTWATTEIDANQQCFCTSFNFSRSPDNKSTVMLIRHLIFGEYYDKITNCSIHCRTMILEDRHKQVLMDKCAASGTAPFTQCIKKPLMWGYKGDGMKRMKIMQRCLTVQWPHPAFHLSLAQFDSLLLLTRDINMQSDTVTT